MTIPINRKGRGLRKTASKSVASASGLTTSGVTLLSGTSDKVLIAHRIYFQYPTDVTKWDMDIKIDCIETNGTAYDLATIDDSGTNGPTDLRAVFDYDVPNPPSGYVYGYIELSNVALANGDSIKLVGNDSTAGNNYTSSGGTAMQATVVYEELDSKVYWANI